VGGALKKRIKANQNLNVVTLVLFLTLNVVEYNGERLEVSFRGSQPPPPAAGRLNAGPGLKLAHFQSIQVFDNHCFLFELCLA